MEKIATRRRFLQGLGASAGCLLAGCEIEDVSRLVDDVRVQARIGVLANTEIAWQSETRMLEKAFRYYRQERVDAVVIAGNVTKQGYANQKEVLKAVWAKVFGPASKVRLILDEGRYEVKGFAFGVAHRVPVRRCEVLTFHGEGKGALTDDMAFFDPVYGVVYAGSMSALTVPAGFSWNGRPADGRSTVQCAQGLLVSAYASKVVVRRLDFTPSAPPEGSLAPGEIYAEDVADALELPREGPYERPEPKPPEFWTDAIVQVLPGFEGASPIYTVKWPSVQKRYTGVRAYCYEVSVHMLKPGADKPARPFRRRNVFSEFYLQSELRENQPVKTVFRPADLEQARKSHAEVVVSVAPLGPFGDRGRPVFTRPFAP